MCDADLKDNTTSNTLELVIKALAGHGSSFGHKTGGEIIVVGLRTVLEEIHSLNS